MLIFFSILFHFFFLLQAGNSGEIVESRNDLKTGLPIYMRKKNEIDIIDAKVISGGLMVALGLSIKFIDKIISPKVVGRIREAAPGEAVREVNKIKQVVKNIGWLGFIGATLGIGAFGFGVKNLVIPLLGFPAFFYGLKKLARNDDNWWHGKDEDNFFSDSWADLFIAGGGILSGAGVVSNQISKSNFYSRQDDFFNELVKNNKNNYQIKDYFNIEKNNTLDLREKQQNFAMLIKDKQTQEKLDFLMSAFHFQGLEQIQGLEQNKNWRKRKNFASSLLKIMYYNELLQDFSLENIPKALNFFNEYELEIWNKIGGNVYQKIRIDNIGAGNENNKEYSIADIFAVSDGNVSKKYPIFNNDQNVEKILPVANFGNILEDIKKLYFEEKK